MDCSGGGGGGGGELKLLGEEAFPPSHHHHWIEPRPLALVVYSGIYFVWNQLLLAATTVLHVGSSGWCCKMTCMLVLLVCVTVVIILSANPHFNRPLRMALYRPFSPKFPYPRKDFIGREVDVEILVGLIDFSNSMYEIISIVGSPGIGKSSLAIYIGNEMILNRAVVHYVNMAEFPDGQLKQVLAEKIFQNFITSPSENITFHTLLAWASNRYWNNLIVLDNCDECINSQRYPFQEAVEELLLFSDSNIKFIVTSREETSFSEPSYVHKVKPLSEDSACKLLAHKIHSGLNQTEKREIAKLTGEMPLALQVIGSLLNVKVAPPTPGEIITKLKKNPIPTLSPPKLARSMHLNYSIGLSYDYLDAKLQKISKYLAHFPGSFHMMSAVHVLAVISDRKGTLTENFEYFSHSIYELLSRSLLEIDESSGRYRFHRLIKEFLLLYKSDAIKQRFNRAFQKYYGSVLCQLTGKYMKSPKEALSLLDVERHNIQYFMTTGLHDPVNQSLYRDIIFCFNFALRIQFLVHRFSPEELISPVRRVTSYLTVALSNREINFELRGEYFTQYVNYIISLASLTKTLQGNSEAVKQFMRKVDIIEQLGNEIPSTNRDYVTFYHIFLEFESELDDDKVKLYYERILRKTVDSTLRCEVCDNNQIGRTYFELGDYNTSIKFFEKANNEDYYGIQLAAAKVRILLHLRWAYILTHNLDKMLEVDKKLLDMFYSMINETSSIVYSAMHWYSEYANFLSELSESEKKLAIIERMYEALFELDKKDIYISLDTASSLAKVLIKHQEYHRAAKVALYTLEHVENSQPTMIHEKIRFHMFLNKATYLSKNFSEANKLIVETLDFLINSNLTEPYVLDFTECCSHLLYLGNLDYLSICLPSILPKVYGHVNSYLQVISFMLFQIPIMEPDSQPETAKEKELPMELYPQIIKHSKSKNVLFDDKKDIAPKYPDLQSARPKKKLVSRSVKWLYRYAISFVYIRFILNFASIFIRLVILYYCTRLCFYFPFWCIRFVLNLRPVTLILQHIFLLHLKLCIALHELTS